MKSIITSLVFALALLSGQAQAEDKASLDFRIIVPEMMQITPSLHPNITESGENKELFTITHNLPRLCLSVTTTNQDPAWEMKVSGRDWQVIRYASGYQLCTYTKGRVPLDLRHTFAYLGQPWPVRLTISPI